MKISWLHLSAFCWVSAAFLDLLRNTLTCYHEADKSPLFYHTQKPFSFFHAVSFQLLLLALMTSIFSSFHTDPIFHINLVNGSSLCAAEQSKYLSSTLQIVNTFDFKSPLLHIHAWPLTETLHDNYNNLLILERLLTQKNEVFFLNSWMVDDTAKFPLEIKIFDLFALVWLGGPFTALY